MSAMPRSATGAPPPERLDAGARREALLDVAQTLVEEGGSALVSMGTVAERAEVTRALVYKHFANKEDILAALYRREATALDRALRHKVATAPDGFEPKLRAFIRAVLDAVGSHDHVFAPPIYRREQRSWDRRTVKYFAGLAAEDLGLDETVARSALGMLLSGVDSVISQARSNRSARHRAMLEDLFVEMAMAALRGLTERAPRD
jgi:AcrR family transcriptional regulator